MVICDDFNCLGPQDVPIHKYIKGPCTLKVSTLPAEYLQRDDVKSKVHTIRAHGPLP